MLFAFKKLLLVCYFYDHFAETNSEDFHDIILVIAFVTFQRLHVTSFVLVSTFSQHASCNKENSIQHLRTFAPKSFHAQIFFKLARQKGNDILLPKREKKNWRSTTSLWSMPRKIP